MNEPRSLAPPEATARLKQFGKLPFGFGPRFLVMMLLGLLWVVPAWWVPRMIAGLFLWDFLVLAAFVFDLLRLPKPREIQASRIWEHAPALATASDVTIHVENFGRTTIRCALVDETPASLRNTPPTLESMVVPGIPARLNYRILPRERGDTRMGRLFVRYQTRFGFAEQWAVAEISQAVRVLPDLAQAVIFHRGHANHAAHFKQA